MKDLNRKASIVATLMAGLFVFTANATAETDVEAQAQREIRACIAEIDDRADYSDASRVRHRVEVMKRRAVGYKLSIETAVYAGEGADTIREYATSCVAFGGAEPVRFRIAETAHGG